MCNNLAAFSCVIISGIPPFLLLSSPFHSLSLFYSLCLFITLHTHTIKYAQMYIISLSLLSCLSHSFYLSIYLVEIFSSSLSPSFYSLSLSISLPFTLSLSLSLSLYAFPFQSLSLSIPFTSLSYLSLPLYISSSTFLFLSLLLSLFSLSFSLAYLMAVFVLVIPITLRNCYWQHCTIMSLINAIIWCFYWSQEESILLSL